MNQKYTSFIHLFFISALVFILYWQANHFEFVLDDKIVITENAFVKKGAAGIKEIFGNDSMTGFLGKQANLLEGGRYRPLSLAVFALEYQYFELQPFYYHLFNLAFYLLSCVILYLLLLRLFKSASSSKKNLHHFVFVATLIFAAHPTHTEAVANVKGLDEILALLFALLSFWLALLFFDSKKVLFLILSLFSFFMALFAKESVLPLVLAIPVALYFFRNTDLKTVLRFFVFFLIPTVLYLIIRYQAMGFLLHNEIRATGIMNNPYFETPAIKKAGTILVTLLLYIKLLFFPHPLTHDYYPYQIQLISVFHPLALLSFVALAFLIVFAACGIKNRNQLSYIIFFFFVSISIVSNVVINVGTFMNERFLFIPSVALPVLIVFILNKYWKHQKTKWILAGVLTLVLVGFNLKSYFRIPVWENEKTLNVAAIKVSKNSARANCFYGVSLYNQVLKDSVQSEKIKRIAEAKKYINRSLEIYPEYSDALRMKAGLAGEDYKLNHDAATLLKVFKEVLSVKHVAYVDEFTNWLERRVDKKIMTDYYFECGYNIFAVKHRNYTLANQYLEKGYRLQPNHPGVLFGLCVVNYLSSDYKKAIEFGQKYLQQNPGHAEILFYIGNAQIKSGKPLIGRQNLEKAYQLKPELKNK